MPPLHPMIVHFPIALYLVAVLFDFIGMFQRKATLNSATRLLYLFSWISAGVAVLTGTWLKESRGKLLSAGAVDLHEALAIAFCIWLTGLLLIRLRRFYRPTWKYMTLGIVGAILLALVGHTGGSMAWPALPVAATALPGSQNTATSNVTSGEVASAAANSNSPSTGTSSNQTTASNQAGTSTATTGRQTTRKTSTPPAKTGSSKTKSTGTSNGSHTSTSTVNQVLYQEGARFFVGECQSCHSLGLAEQYYGTLSSSQWQQVVTTMQGYAGGAITTTQAQAITYYLEHHP